MLHYGFFIVFFLTASGSGVCISRSLFHLCVNFTKHLVKIHNQRAAHGARRGAAAVEWAGHDPYSQTVFATDRSAQAGVVGEI